MNSRYLNSTDLPTTKRIEFLFKKENMINLKHESFFNKTQFILEVIYLSEGNNSSPV